MPEAPAPSASPDIPEPALRRLRRGFPFRRELIRPILLVGGPLLVVIGAAYFYVAGSRFVSTDDAYVKQDKLPISTDVSGRALEVLAHDQEFVQQGQVLFRLDAEPFRIAVERAQANLAAVRMEIDSRRNLEIARQDALASRAGAMGAAAAYDRNPNLPIDEHPLVMQAQAQLDQARLDLSYATVAAPVTGTIANFDLRPGIYVRAGSPVFTIVAAQPLWIEANFKETDLTHVHTGQLATVTADAFPGRVIHTRVDSINPGTGSEFSLLPPQNASGNWVKVVQRLPVRLVPLDLDRNVPLRAGMSVTAEIDTGYIRPVFGLFHSRPTPNEEEAQPAQAAPPASPNGPDTSGRVMLPAAAAQGPSAPGAPEGAALRTASVPGALSPMAAAAGVAPAPNATH